MADATESTHRPHPNIVQALSGTLGDVTLTQIDEDEGGTYDHLAALELGVHGLCSTDGKALNSSSKGGTGGGDNEEIRRGGGGKRGGEAAGEMGASSASDSEEDSMEPIEISEEFQIPKGTVSSFSV